MLRLGLCTLPLVLVKRRFTDLSGCDRYFARDRTASLSPFYLLQNKTSNRAILGLFGHVVLETRIGREPGRTRRLGCFKKGIPCLREQDAVLENSV
jgi:hypothetical protein